MLPATGRHAAELSVILVTTMGEKKNQKMAGSHTALYRKYRSRSLDEIKGQEHITKTLKNALAAGKISHAYLFTGPRGTGKTSIARILAHEINGLPYDDEKTHLDIIEIDAASNRRIDDVRDLREKVHIAPVAAKYKVYIIDEVHMLTTESFNALLKTLEEPPEHAVFILATTEAHKLPATIISRTQRHSFRFIPKGQITQHLAEIAKNEAIQIEEAALELLAEHGGGSFRDSISLLDQMSGSGTAIDAAFVELLLGIAPIEKLQQLLQASLAGDTKAIFEQTEELLAYGLTPSALAVQLIGVIRSKLQAGERSPQLTSALTELLTVHSAQYQRLRLETILLGFAPPSEAQTSVTPAAQAQPVVVSEKPQTKPQPTPPQQKTAAPADQQAEKEPPKEEAKSAEKPIKTQPGSFDITQQWPEVLQQVKQKNNSLYTVLRMAGPELSGDELLLYFSFPFHQKKLEEAKHKALLIECLRELTGRDISIQTKVDKQKASSGTAAARAADPAHASLIQSVQDIMGGGEVVNV